MPRLGFMGWWFGLGLNSILSLGLGRVWVDSFSNSSSPSFILVYLNIIILIF